MSVAARARELLGVRFRLHGRSRAHGVDCIGLAAHAFDAAVPDDYALRGGSVRRIAALAAAAGLTRVDPETGVVVGDLLVMRVGAGQLHLGIAGNGGLIHADAALRKVVERPGTPPWPLIALWRWEEG